MSLQTFLMHLGGVFLFLIAMAIVVAVGRWVVEWCDRIQNYRKASALDAEVGLREKRIAELEAELASVREGAPYR